MWILRRGAGFPGAALGSSHKQATREARQAEEAAIKARIFEIYRQFLDAEEVPGDGSEEDMPSSEETLEAKEAQADAPEKDVADDEVTKKDEPQQEIKGIEQQLKKGEKDFDATVCKGFDARLYKPQRLVSLSYEEEEKRALEGWWWFDWMLNLACFRQRVWKQTCLIFFECVFFPDPQIIPHCIHFFLPCPPTHPHSHAQHAPRIILSKSINFCVTFSLTPQILPNSSISFESGPYSITFNSKASTSTKSLLTRATSFGSPPSSALKVCS